MMKTNASRRRNRRSKLPRMEFDHRLINAIGSHISTLSYESGNLTQFRNKLKELAADDKLWKTLQEYMKVTKTIRSLSDISLDW